jgi:hypothetical protein
MTICDYEQAALDVGAVHYSPAPLRAVKGISFTYDQLIEFSEKLKAVERNKVLAEMSQIEPVGYGLSESEMGIGFDRKFGNVVWFKSPVVGKLYTHPFIQPAEMMLVPVEPTKEMIIAYLKANSEYWDKHDAMPRPVGKWCAGNTADATAESYKAMLSAAKGE